MTLLDSIREQFANLEDGGTLMPAEVEVRLPSFAVAHILREVLKDRPREIVTCSGSNPWLRIYESWGCIYIRSKEAT